MVDMEDRLFQRIDRFEERLDDTCNRIEKIDAFITIKEEQAEKKFNRALGVLGTIIGAVGLFSIMDYLPSI
jgi:hypothetical protein|tara:strand:- start:327 stop:539 length:213 start_codon:yes stop_codon:yes gene_type:complete